MTFCIDCGKSITIGCKRCCRCNKIYQWTDPEYSKTMRDKMIKGLHSKCCHDAISKSVKQRWTSVKYKQFMHNVVIAGNIKRCTKEYRKICSNRMKMAMNKYYSDPINKLVISKRIRAYWADPTGNMRKSLYYKHITFKPSSLEIKFKQYLDDANIIYIQQYRPKGCYRVYDFILADYNILIEIDGYFWHHSDYAIKHRVHERDAEKEKWAINNGYDFVRIPENDMPSDIVTGWLIPEVLQGVTNAI